MITAPGPADYYRRCWLGIIKRTPNMCTLIRLGVIVALSTGS